LTYTDVYMKDNYEVIKYVNGEIALDVYLNTNNDTVCLVIKKTLI